MKHVPMPAGAPRVYQLHEASVSPVRAAGRDANGVPREETVCVLAKFERFVDLKGNICDVPLRTSRVTDNSSEAEKYEAVMRKDQVIAGCLPLAECPYSTEYARIVNPERSPDLQDSLVAVPAGEVACRGEASGCSHLRPIIESRRVAARAAHEIQEMAGGRNISVEAAGALMRELGAGIASGNVPASVKASREALKNGKGE